jgi:hypothetical protein
MGTSTTITGTPSGPSSTTSETTTSAVVLNKAVK